MNSEISQKLKDDAKIIEEMIESFGIKVRVMEIEDMSDFNLFSIDFMRGVKFEEIESLSKTLSMSLVAPSEIEIKLIPGKKLVGIYVPKK